MSAPVDPTDQGVDAIPRSTAAPNWTINVSDIRTVKVNNISMVTTEKDIRDFFSFSGEIRYVEMQRETESTQIAYVTFKDSQEADTAALLTGSNIANVSVTITPVENYQLPPDALPSSPEKKQTSAAVKKAEDVVSTMLAKGFILGKDAINRAKSFDERHNLTSNASAAVASIDRKMDLSGKLSIGTSIVNDKVREMDEKFHVSEKTKSAIAVAEQKASSIMSYPYVSTGASWVSTAFTAVAKAAEDVSTMTKEKVELAQVEKKDIIFCERKGTVDELAQIHSEKPSEIPAHSGHDSKLGIM
ncbi:binding partner of ACD11 1-like [Gastrolobium bilobum]|uniref:binding partner of ACD11 1-like n=1 Tax=Gastrolobium bilobum TaxID=150636 RepID=UPI002AB173BA|nr:binding partner of ACD11 1-like [Gastrolobium bilobum]